MTLAVKKPKKIRGAIDAPPDKSISHRAVIFNAVSTGTSIIQNFSASADCLSTVRCLRQLGAQIGTIHTSETAKKYTKTLQVTGLGEKGITEPTSVLNAGNSGTTMRLLMGVLAANEINSVLTGDHSLRSRPMIREIRALREMGSEIWARGDRSLPPISINGKRLRGGQYTMPEASAQLKSTLLLAGLFSEEAITIDQPHISRDHSERMLTAMGAPIVSDGLQLTIQPGPIRATDITVPGDISSASFWLVLGLCHPDSEVTVRNVNINPSRAGFLEVIEQMGGSIKITNQAHQSGEPIADLTATSSSLSPVVIEGALIPLLIDELPILALAACFARGETFIKDASSLRVKETDRIATTTSELRRIGANIEETPDGMIISGVTSLQGGRTSSHGDHRLAMTLGIAGMLAEGETEIAHPDSTKISYPGFWDDLEMIAQGALASNER